MKRIIIVISILVFTLAVVIALGVDRNTSALAQSPQPPDLNQSEGGENINLTQWNNNLPEGESIDSEIQASYPTAQMSYQGRLELDGSPVNGPINITFSLYTEASGGTALWTETQNVTVDNGLFSVMLGKVTPLPYAQQFYNQLWLGVKPAGAAAELTPRQMLGTVGYAMNVLPGATMVDENPGGGYGYSFWVSSANHSGIYGASSKIYGVGVQGSSYYTDSIGVYGYASGFDSPGVMGIANGDDEGCAYGDDFCNAGVVSEAWGDSYASSSYADSDARCAYLGQTDNNSFYTAYFNNFGGTAAAGLGVNGYANITGDLTVGGTIYPLAPMAINAGSEPLERGDVVVVVGMEEAILGEHPVLRVQKATPETASSIVGVVDVLYEACEKSPEELQAGEACGGFNHDVTTIQPGQYLSLVTQGTFEWLKVDASTPIKAGDLLSISPTAGVAAKAHEITVDGVSFYAPGTIIGKAISELESGTGVIAVFVSLK